MKLDVLTKLDAAKTSLLAFDMKARVLPDGNYEIGFALPENYQTVQKVEKFLGDVRLLLSQLAANGNTAEEFKISYVNNGTIQFYIEAGQVLAQHFDIILDYALKIYAGVEMVSKVKGQIDKFAAKRKTEVAKLMEEEQKEQAKRYEEEMFLQLEITHEADKTATKLIFRKFLKHLESGVAAEVRTPNLPLPPEPAEADEKPKRMELAQRKKSFLANEEINNRNKEIYMLQKHGFEGISLENLLPPGEDQDEDNA
jgi:hypothetical protein